MNKLNKIIVIIGVLLMIVQTGSAYTIPVELKDTGITDEYGLIVAAMALHDKDMNSPELVSILNEASIHLTNSGRTYNDYEQLRQVIEKTRKQRGG